MIGFSIRAASVALAGLALVSACDLPGSERADFIPERIPGGQGAVGFCDRDADGLYVRVRNQSNVAVLTPTVVRVVFSPGGPVVVNAPPMPGGSFARVGPFAIPAGCFSQDCGFSIEVDLLNQIDEAIETNNRADGLCIG